MTLLSMLDNKVMLLHLHLDFTMTNVEQDKCLHPATQVKLNGFNNIFFFVSTIKRTKGTLKIV